MTQEQAILETFRWAMQLSELEISAMLATMAIVGLAVGVSTGKILNILSGR